MQTFNGLLREVPGVLRQTRGLILYFAATNIVFLILGQWMAALGIPEINEFRQRALEEIPELIYIRPLTGILAPYLTLKILYTFLFNLIFGAFISTTLTGVVFFIPYLMTVWRSFLVGVLFYGIGSSPAVAAAFYGTFILEFAGYCFSAVAGTNIGLSLIRPSRMSKTTRKEAFLASLRQGLALYVVISILLFLGAVWEITWLHYTWTPPKP